MDVFKWLIFFASPWKWVIWYDDDVCVYHVSVSVIWEWSVWECKLYTLLQADDAISIGSGDVLNIEATTQKELRVEVSFNM